MGKERGGRFKREETYVYPWLIHVDVWQKPLQYRNYPPIKNKKFLNDKKSKGILLIMLGNVCAASQVQEYLTSRNRIDIIFF